MLKQRIITALILIPCFVWAVLKLPTLALAAIFAAVTLLGAWEWSRLFALSAGLRAFYLILFVVLLAVGYNVAFVPEVVKILMGIAVLWWVVAFFWIKAAQRRHRSGQANVGEGEAPRLSSEVGVGLASGYVVLLPTFISLCFLHSDARFGPGYVLFCMTLMWVADTAAYFAGRRWGKRKLAPWVSPGKSWEGVGGALAGCLLWSVGGAVALGVGGVGAVAFVIWCLIAAMFSIVGDLFESMMKRIAHVKDSSQLLPGHGGIMDRIDSITAGAPVFAFGMLLWL